MSPWTMPWLSGPPLVRAAVDQREDCVVAGAEDRDVAAAVAPAACAALRGMIWSTGADVEPVADRCDHVMPSSGRTLGAVGCELVGVGAGGALGPGIVLR